MEKNENKLKYRLKFNNIFFKIMNFKSHFRGLSKDIIKLFYCFRKNFTFPPIVLEKGGQ